MNGAAEKITLKQTHFLLKKCSESSIKIKILELLSVNILRTDGFILNKN
jgi:hypothetical protein